MAAATTAILGGLSLAVTAAGTVAAISEQQKSAKLQKRAIDIQQNQADLEAGRQRRQVYRDMLKAQATSETNAAASGGLASSSLQGGLAQATNSGFQSTRDINQNQQNANAMFDVKRASVGIGQTSNILMGIGKGLSSLSGFLSGPKTA